MATRRTGGDPAEEGMGPLERGRRRYQSKDYDGALAAFKEAVAISSSHMLLTALDHRAATYEKLEQFKSALRDSKEMIELKPDFAKGYLRCAKILQLMGDDELALKIFERGLKKVKIGGDKDRTILQSMFSKLQRKKAPRKNLDPLVKLPTELAEIVCQYLDIRDRVICLSVSKSWKRLLESSHQLWTVLDTTGARRAVTDKSLRAYLRRSNYTLERAKITMAQERRGGFNDAKISYLTKTCKQLQNLEIRGPGLIGDSLTKALPNAQSLKTLHVHSNCQIPLACIPAALESTRATLKEASFLSVNSHSRFQAINLHWPGPAFEMLTTLRLRAVPVGGFAPQLVLSSLVDAFPNLTLLCVSQWDISSATSVDLTRWSNLKHLDINDTGLVILPLLPPTLEYLDVSRNLHLDSRLNIEEEPSELPLLKHFNCYCTSLRGKMIGAITMPSIKAGNLKALHVGGSDRRFLMALTTIEETFLASAVMEEFSIADAYMEEKQVLQIVKQYPNLQKLDVSGSKITGVAVKEFVAMGIKRLKMIECPNISPDAPGYARGKGVEVEFGFPSRIVSRRSFRDIGFA